ncbi:MAG: hypothetical protein QM658_14235 [Gordonia sp. (in: high G+C Gram-positive bacteria)]
MTEIQSQYQPSVLPQRSAASAVEAQRAATEVQAQYLVAQQCPRSLDRAIATMQEATRQMLLAERAFFRFPRGGQSVSGPSIQLARELARCWGNIDYGLKEIARRPGESEMMAYAVDLETNARASTTFIVPHRRDKRGVAGGEELTETRDIYELNANVGARRLREQIFNLLPVWFREQAMENCRATLKDGGGVPLPQRIAKVVAGFDPFGVTRVQLEDKLGRPSDQWTGHDVAQLIVIGKSIDAGETTIAAEFPPESVSTDDVVARRAATNADTKVSVAARLDPRLVAELGAAFDAQGWSDDAGERLRWVCEQVGDVASFEVLSPEQARRAIALLTGGDQ